MKVSLLALLLAGCSQIFGLDSPAEAPGDGRTTDALIDSARPDAPAACGTHDYDGDGIPDGCDMCPYIASLDDPDSDGDGVGDACDPQPATPGNYRQLWMAFYDASEITGWANYNNGVWSISGNHLHQTSNLFSLLDSPTSYTDVHLAGGLAILQAATNEVGFCVGDIETSNQTYCCGATNMTTPTVRALDEYGGSGTMMMSSAFPGDLSTGKALDITATVTASGFKCEFRQGQVVTTTMLPAGARTGPVAFYATKQVDFLYLFVVTMAP